MERPAGIWDKAPYCRRPFLSMAGSGFKEKRKRISRIRIDKTIKRVNINI